MTATPSPHPLPRSVSPARSPLRGRLRAPGDKSISHRAIILGALAEGTTTVSGLLEGADIHSTIGAMRSLGAQVSRDGDGWRVEGFGARGPDRPGDEIDCGNAGTGVRLVMGALAGAAALAGRGIEATFTGDASLSSRPMGRVLDPLAEMGVAHASQPGGRLPARLSCPAALAPLVHTPAQASAQVKSAVLLAGLGADGVSGVIEARPSRDHTENMLSAFGVEVAREATPGGRRITVSGPARLRATHVDVPGDPSSAAFAVVAATLVEGSDVVVGNVMLNPTRTGLFDTLREMGASIEEVEPRTSGGERVADLRVRSRPLRGVVVPPDRAPSMIDEYPVLAVAAAFADGPTTMGGIGELRVKESDRVSATAAILRAAGAGVEEGPDSLVVAGRGWTPRHAGPVPTHHDHRIAMSAFVMGLAGAGAVVDDAGMIATSYPGFFDHMRGLGAEFA